MSETSAAATAAAANAPSTALTKRQSRSTKKQLSWAVCAALVLIGTLVAQMLGAIPMGVQRYAMSIVSDYTPAPGQINGEEGVAPQGVAPAAAAAAIAVVDRRQEASHDDSNDNTDDRMETADAPLQATSTEDEPSSSSTEEDEEEDEPSSSSQPEHASFLSQFTASNPNNATATSSTTNFSSSSTHNSTTVHGNTTTSSSSSLDHKKRHPGSKRSAAAASLAAELPPAFQRTATSRQVYTFDAMADRDEYDLDNLNIRQWGCARREESPLIFVHIGKAGGGSIRARLAASALEYNRTSRGSGESWGNTHSDNSYYYPMTHLPLQPATTTSSSLRRRLEENGSNSIDASSISNDNNGNNNATNTTTTANRIYKGVFVNSGFTNFRPAFPKTPGNLTDEDKQFLLQKRWKTYEKTLPCAATTPLGQAIACPLIKYSQHVSKACLGTKCHVVYVGHNLMGSEMHWLPTQYLSAWWSATPWGQAQQPQVLLLTNQTTYSANSTSTTKKTKKDDKPIALLWRQRHRRWMQPNSPCNAAKKHHYKFYEERFFDCVAPYEEGADKAANMALQAQPKEPEQQDDHPPPDSTVDDWSPMYASLPLLRGTMLREPFSWLVSKFFWHRNSIGSLIGRQGDFVQLVTCDMNRTNFEAIADWVGPAVQKQIDHLCGEDCLVRMQAGKMTLEQSERQARHNLQHSFAVVGLLNETQTFFDMITARVAYMNTSLNLEVQGSKHSTSNQKEYQRCHDIYQSPDFQEQLLAVCPELAALQRLYRVGVRVNRFQRQEMQSCGLFDNN